MWPTPLAQEAKHGAPTEWEMTTTHVGTAKSLRVQVAKEEARMWPTPRASEYKDCGPVGSKSHTHMHDRKYLCAAVKDSQKPTGTLNPTWVEWLMGYPKGWTDLKD